MLDILSLKGHDNDINNVKQSDLDILIHELERKKVKITIITDIGDLTFKNPIYVHDFSGCFDNHHQFKIFIDNFNINVAYCKFQLNIELSDTNNENVKDLWMQPIPKIFVGTTDYNDIKKHSNADVLYMVKSLGNSFIYLLPFGLMNYLISNVNSIQLIKKYMTDKKVTKAFVRCGHGHHPSFLVDLNDDNSFNIDIDKYFVDTIGRQMIMVHPIYSETLYMKGVISLIYIDGKYAHAIIKKPINTNIGIGKYIIKKYTPGYYLSCTGKKIVRLLATHKYPFIQLNFAHLDSIFEYALSKVNYIDPKLYLDFNKKHVKKIRKNIITQMSDVKTLRAVKNALTNSK